MTDSIPKQRADRTQLQQIIAGLTEGVIIINPDQTISWANETALALHGVASVKDLGNTVSEYRHRFELRYRNRHKLPEGDYPMERLVAGEAFSEVVVEVVRPGEDKRWVHQIRSLVLTDPKGQPDCLVLVLNDETERFNAEERGAEKRDLAIKRLHAGATIPQMEGCLSLPDGQEKTVLLGGQPILTGDEACMLFTFADLHPRKQAEDALRQSEERFATAFRMAPGPMAIMALDGLRILDVNDAFTAATGWRREEVVGRSEAELEVWGHGELREQLEGQIKKTGHIRSVDIQLRAKSGEVGTYLLSAETVTIHHQRCVLSVMQDITERKQTEMELMAAIEAVMQDTSWFGQKIMEKLASLTRPSGLPSPGPNLASLSPRAREVLGMVAQGLSDEDIAGKLGLTRNTVRNHVFAIYTKIGLHRRSAVVVWARERGLGAQAKLRATRVKSKPRPPR